MVWWFIAQVAILAIGIVLSEYLRPKPRFENAKPAGLGDFQFPTTTEGRPVPIHLGGTVMLRGPNTTWTGDLEQIAITETVKTGLWSKAKVIRGYQYRLGLQLKLCRGVVELLSAQIAEKDITTGTLTAEENRFDIDQPNLFGGSEHGTGGIQATVDFYSGTYTQPVNAYLNDDSRKRIPTAITPTAPREAGTSHVVIRELTSAAPSATDRGAYLGNSTTLAHWAFELRCRPGIFSGQSAGQDMIGTYDANPANVVYRILTNTEWGRGRPASSIDVGTNSSFHKFAQTCAAEGLGFSMLVDDVRETDDILGVIMDHVDGTLFQHPNTGKWTVQLVRESGHAYFGWDINTVPLLDDDSIAEVKSYGRDSWEETTNVVHVRFVKRDDNYKESTAIDQNMSTAIILSGGSHLTPVGSVGVVAMPGVMDEDLAAKIANRELRGRSYPLLRAEFETTRKFYDLTVGQVVAWTDPIEGFTKLPMRVSSIDYGTTTDGKMTISCVQDVFTAAAASFGSPPGSKWTPPSVSLVAFPSDEQLGIESPRGIVTRDPDFSGDAAVARVLCAARRQAGEVAFQIKQRNSSGTPSGPFAEDGEVVAFARIGELDSALAAGTDIPTSAITITPTPDSQTSLLEVFASAVTLEDMGSDLAHLILIDDEFMLVHTASANGGDVDLEDVYRGVLGTGQASHAAGASVWLLFVGAGLADSAFPNDGHNVDLELRPRSASTIFAGSVTTIQLTTAQRALRPYPPGAVFYNGGGTEFDQPDLEGDGSGLNGVGFDVDWWRRRYDTTDEITELGADNEPDASTEHRVRVYVDPAGANVLAFDSDWVSGSGPETPTQVAIVNEAAAGTTIRVRIDSRHDIENATDLENHSPLLHDVTPTSTRTAQFYLGGDRAAGVATNVYTAAATGTFTVNIGTAFASAIEYRINGGTWTALTGYTAGVSTSGTIAGVSSSDTIELRHDTNTALAQNFVEIRNPSATSVAYGVFTNGT